MFSSATGDRCAVLLYRSHRRKPASLGVIVTLLAIGLLSLTLLTLALTPASAFAFTSTSFTTATLSQLDLAAIDIADFGAKGDGVHDDTSAIQAALDAASEQGSETELSTVRFPAGRYALSRDLQLPSNVQLVSVRATLVGAGLSLSGVSHVQVSGLAVENARYAALSINACQDVDIAGFSVDGFATAEDAGAYPGLLLQGASVAVCISGNLHAEESLTQSVRAVRFEGSGYELSDFSIDFTHSGTFVVSVEDTAFGNTFHTNQALAVLSSDQAARANDIRTGGSRASLYGGGDMSSSIWDARFCQNIVLDFIPVEGTPTLSNMPPCYPGVVRTLTLNAATINKFYGTNARLENGPAGQCGSINWLSERTIWRGASEVVRLEAQEDGTWQELTSTAAEHEFATVADMQEHRAELSEGDIATTKRFREAGSLAGGARYLICRQGTYFTDNNGQRTEIFREDGRHVKLGGDTDLWAVLQVKPGDTVDLYQFGAVGDGVANDSAAFEQAIESGAAKVHVSAGAYAVHDTYVNLEYLPDASLELVGDSKESCVILGLANRPSNLWRDGGYTSLMSAWYSEHLRIAHLSFCANTASSFYDNSAVSGVEEDHFGTTHLALWHVKGVEIEDCIIQDNWPAVPDNADCGDVNAGVQIFGADGVTMRNCGLYSLDCSFIAMGNWDVRNVTVDHCDFDGHRVSEPIVFMMSSDKDMTLPAPIGENLTVTNNTIRNCENAQSIVFNDGVREEQLVREQRTLIAGDDWDNPEARCTRYKNIRVENNYMENMANSLTLRHVYGGIVRANTSINAGAMNITDCHDLLIEDYTSRNSVSAAIYMLWENSDVTFRNLVVDNYGTSGAESCALSLSDVARNVVFESGFIRGGAANQPAVIFAGGPGLTACFPRGFRVSPPLTPMSTPT